MGEGLNHYPRHIGDWLRDTAHLSEVEECIYSRCIDQYYSREKPLPLDLGQCARLVRAASAAARKALATILPEFFTQGPDGWHQKRCDEEIAHFKDRSVKATASAYASVEARRSNAGIRAERMRNARAQGTHTRDDWLALVAFCGGKCVMCGNSGHLDRDHIKPVYQGGSDSIENIQPLCAACNAGKGADSTDRRPDGWREALASANAQRTLSERSANQNQEPVTIKTNTAASPPARSPSSSRRKPQTQVPEDFAISEGVQKWADANGIGRLQAHLEHFKFTCAAKGYVYSDHDAAFKKAIRGDWAKLGETAKVPKLTILPELPRREGDIPDAAKALIAKMRAHG